MSKRPAEEQLQGGPPKKENKDVNGDDRPAPLYEGVYAPGMRRKPEPRRPVLVYRDHEPLHGLTEHWRNSNGEEMEVEVLIAPEFLSKDNKRVKSRQLWGDLVYTRDSDIVAVLMHMGFYASSLAHAPQAIIEARAVVRLKKPPRLYPSKQRFLKSRAWNSRMLGPQAPAEQDGPAYTVERFLMVTRSGYIIELPPCIDGLPAPNPTVQPQASDRSQTTTRNTGSKGKVAQDVSVQYNLANEPWLKYTLAAIADKGLKPGQLTSARLLDHVLFVETSTHRYQISRVGPGEDPARDLYVFHCCTKVLPASVMQRVGLPLPATHVRSEAGNVTWEEFQWGVSQLIVRGKSYQIKRMHLMRTCKAEEPV